MKGHVPAEIKSPIRLSPPRSRGRDRRYAQHRSHEESSPVRIPPHKRPEYNVSSSESSSSDHSYEPSVSSRSSSPDSPVKKQSHSTNVVSKISPISLSRSESDSSPSVSLEHTRQQARKRGRSRSPSPISPVLRAYKKRKGSDHTSPHIQVQQLRKGHGDFPSRQTRGRQMDRDASPLAETLPKDLSIGSSFSSSGTSRSPSPLPPQRRKLKPRPSSSPSKSPSPIPVPPSPQRKRYNVKGGRSPPHHISRRQDLSPKQVPRQRKSKYNHSSRSPSPAHSSASSLSPVLTPVRRHQKEQDTDDEGRLSSPHPDELRKVYAHTLLYMYVDTTGYVHNISTGMHAYCSPMW